MAAVIARCTAKLRALLGHQQERADFGYSQSRLVRQPVGHRAAQVRAGDARRNPVLGVRPHLRVAQLRPFGPFVVARIVAQLHAEGFPEQVLGELDGAHVTIAGTARARSVLGCMNDLALTCRLAVEDAGGLGSLDLDGLHHVLHRQIYAARGYVPAIDLITGLPPSHP